MLEWVFFVAIAISLGFFYFAWKTDAPYAYAIAGMLLFVTAIFVQIDGGIWRETVTQITSLGGQNFEITSTYNVASTISVVLENNPIAWGINYILMFTGLLFVMYSISNYVAQLRI